MTGGGLPLGSRQSSSVVWFAAILVAAIGAASCSRAPSSDSARVFPSPEDAVQALTSAVQSGKIDDVVAIFGATGRDLVDTTDLEAGRQNREVFAAAIAQGWRLVDDHAGKTLVIGDEGWPFAVPLVRTGDGWRFDSDAGLEEVIARRIGRNELSAIRV